MMPPRAAAAPALRVRDADDAAAARVAHPRKVADAPSARFCHAATSRDVPAPRRLILMPRRAAMRKERGATIRHCHYLYFAAIAG